MEANRFTKEHLITACANFQQLITSPELLVKHADSLKRAMHLPVADVKAVLAATKGDYVKVYYGIMDDVAGEHFIFMGPGDDPVPENKSATSANIAADLLAAEAPQSANFAVALPDCIGKRPPCPEIEDEFIV